MFNWPSSLTILGELWGRNVNFVGQEVAGVNVAGPEVVPAAAVAEEEQDVADDEDDRAIPRSAQHQLPMLK